MLRDPVGFRARTAFRMVVRVLKIRAIACDRAGERPPLREASAESVVRDRCGPEGVPTMLWTPDGRRDLVAF